MSTNPYFDDRINSRTLRHINSMTKYPSIPTLHVIDGNNGVLTEALTPAFAGLAPETMVYATEKINGTNCRIIVFPNGDWIIGSREDLLNSKGDRIPNKTLGIVSAVSQIAHDLGMDSLRLRRRRHPGVYYGEVFGAGIEGGKAYSRKQVSFRLFDYLELDNFDDMLSWPIEKVASWRDHGGQLFANQRVLTEESAETGLELVPQVLHFTWSGFNTNRRDVADFLARYASSTRVALDASGNNKSEGLVLRTHTRGAIAKVRVEDYNRTLRKLAEEEKEQAKALVQEAIQ